MGNFSIKIYDRVLRQKRKSVNKALAKTVEEAAKSMMLQAQSLAPNRNGETIAGINMKHIGRKRWAVESRVPGHKGVKGTFYQNMWANQTGSFFAPKMRWNSFAPTPYGTGPANYTGTPGFFDASIVLTRDKFVNIAKRNNRSALRGVIL